MPDLVAASDTGASDTDSRTNDATPTFAGSAEAFASVTLYAGTKLLGSGVAGADGTWSITTDLLADDAYPIRARASDAAGNSSPLSDPLSVTIDTLVAPSTRPDLSAISDSSPSSTDNMTRIVTPIVQGRAEAGATITLFDADVTIGFGKVGVGLDW